MGSRGDGLKLIERACRKDVRKYFFTNRIVSGWNGLPEDLVRPNNIELERSDAIQDNNNIVINNNINNNNISSSINANKQQTCYEVWRSCEADEGCRQLVRNFGEHCKQQGPTGQCSWHKCYSTTEQLSQQHKQLLECSRDQLIFDVTRSGQEQPLQIVNNFCIDNLYPSLDAMFASRTALTFNELIMAVDREPLDVNTNSYHDCSLAFHRCVQSAECKRSLHDLYNSCHQQYKQHQQNQQLKSHQVRKHQQKQQQQLSMQQSYEKNLTERCGGRSREDGCRASVRKFVLETDRYLVG
ncbi:hypothetical protein HELRODRAFT_180671 [Helobdella robusta]|uniref:GDNF/GAS1 domain-containing protein n=1 Tax=Helobdella robusta TaxID=6412 RepID=T1FG54_HELRO|nr:hypothetical protein HELRODRAFT_180671 [Helobdella robusta]ESN93584.1 hypothetical protein HELRODRAFT_180671 [Helobdella robusta]